MTVNHFVFVITQLYQIEYKFCFSKPCEQLAVMFTLLGCKSTVRLRVKVEGFMESSIAVIIVFLFFVGILGLFTPTYHPPEEVGKDEFRLSKGKAVLSYYFRMPFNSFSLGLLLACGIVVIVEAANGAYAENNNQITFYIAGGVITLLSVGVILAIVFEFLSEKNNNVIDFDFEKARAVGIYMFLMSMTASGVVFAVGMP